MTQLTIYLNDKNTAKILEKLCELLPGVLSLEHDEYINGEIVTEPKASYARPIGNKPKTRKKKAEKNGLDEAIEDIKAGRVYRASSVEDLFSHLND